MRFFGRALLGHDPPQLQGPPELDAFFGPGGAVAGRSPATGRCGGGSNRTRGPPSAARRHGAAGGDGPFHPTVCEAGSNAVVRVRCTRKVDVCSHFLTGTVFAPILLVYSPTGHAPWAPRGPRPRGFLRFWGQCEPRGLPRRRLQSVPLSARRGERPRSGAALARPPCALRCPGARRAGQVRGRGHRVLQCPGSPHGVVAAGHSRPKPALSRCPAGHPEWRPSSAISSVGRSAAPTAARSATAGKRSRPMSASPCDS